VKIGDVIVAALFGLPALALCGPRVHRRDRRCTRMLVHC
jgi:hypothetical protein